MSNLQPPPKPHNAEGYCRQCGTPLGISGLCPICAIEKGIRPDCRTCGSPLNRYGHCTTCDPPIRRIKHFSTGIRHIGSSYYPMLTVWFDDDTVMNYSTTDNGRADANQVIAIFKDFDLSRLAAVFKVHDTRQVHLAAKRIIRDLKLQPEVDDIQYSPRYIRWHKD